MTGAARPPFGLTDWRMSLAMRSIAVRPEAWARACDSLVRAESTPEKKNANSPMAKIDDSAMPISNSMSVKPRWPAWARARRRAGSLLMARCRS